MGESKYREIIKGLEEFKDLFVQYISVFTELKELGKDEKKLIKLYQLREEINKRIPVIKYYFEESGESYNYPLAGREISLFEDVFNPIIYNVLVSLGGFHLTIDAINRCLGFYDYLVKSNKTIADLKSTPIVDIITLIKNNLRKSFDKVPIDEDEVQKHIRTILDVAKANYSKEKESFEYSSKFYTPDFVMKELETTIEAKFCNSKDDESKIIGEINDDILAYKTRYKILIFIIYDVGIIRDEDRFKKNLRDISGVYIEIIKH
jgi:hypothetical protein